MLNSTDKETGGSPETQKEFLETLASDSKSKRSQDRYRKKPPTANDFALGYTYQDVLDADHEGIPTPKSSVITLAEQEQISSPVYQFTSFPSPRRLSPR